VNSSSLPRGVWSRRVRPSSSSAPKRNSVEPYARAIIKVPDQGLVSSVLPPDVDLTDALAVGAEWFGADHPILRRWLRWR
jgi:hypothetical protein